MLPMRRLLCAVFTLMVASAFSQTQHPAPAAGATPFQIVSKSFPKEGNIPAKYTCSGSNVSPDVAWTGAPAATKAFALVLDDPDAPGGTFLHWLIFNIPGTVARLRPAIPKDPEMKDGTRQGKNDFDKLGYDGPCPPPGAPHRYVFHLYALSAPLNMKAGDTRRQLGMAMAGKVLAEAQLTGKFKR
jgi:Raf kinase inhibitor-like YbhB/YbcL family protein